MKVFEPGNTIKHSRNTDVAFHILQSIFDPEKGMHLQGVWFNIVNPAKAYLITETIDTITVVADEMDNWQVYESST